VVSDFLAATGSVVASREASASAAPALRFVTTGGEVGAGGVVFGGLGEGSGEDADAVVLAESDRSVRSRCGGGVV
jgi:hypothetical protein